MKKAVTIILSIALLLSTVGCSSKPSAEPSSSAVGAGESSLTSSAEKTTADPREEAEAKLKKTDYGGVFYVEIDGEPYFSYADGTLENGTEITIDTPIPIGSVSKQFCAASILLLQEQGKLSVKDTLDKYFPEYTQASKITLHDMLDMRSGIPELNRNLASIDKTDEENTSVIMADIFGQPLDEEPDEQFKYSNTNYFLLANIVEKVTEKRYIDFVRESFLEPLNMTHTGSIDEQPDNPAWAQGNTYKKLDCQQGLTKGAGDIVSNAADMTIWLNSLQNGEIISGESFDAMLVDYSNGKQYGYAFRPGIMGGAAHAGQNGIYTAFDYVNEDKHFTLFMASNTETEDKTSSLFMDILGLLLPKE